MNLDPILARLQGVRRNGSGWQARCPAHEDNNPSLAITESNGKILMKCHAGCPIEAVCTAAGIEMHELFAKNGGPAKRIEAVYGYLDEKSELLFEVVRYTPKEFRQRRPNVRGGWFWNLNGVRRVLYRLPEVLAAKSVLVVEGEKDSEAARGLELVATCNPAGAGKWQDEYSECFRGKRVCVIADADTPGRKHAQQVAATLVGRVESLKLLELPGAKDLSEWVARGGTQASLLELIGAASEWKPESVDAGIMLHAIFSFIRRFISLSESQARVLTLWVIHTHAFSAAAATPYMAINSAEKQSGKTRLLEVLNTLAASPWMTGRVTAAVLTRKIDKDHPTLLLDESDTAFGGEKEYSEALRGVLNTGYVIGGSASCCIGQGAAIGFKDFSTFCPKAIAGIGSLPDTVADRSIPIRLKRAAPGEAIERFRRRDVQAESGSLRDTISRWCIAAEEILRDARPELPEELSDRQQDVAEPLLAIADAVGDEWPTAARAALVQLSAEARAAEKSVGVQLLADIRQILSERKVDRIWSEDLAGALAEIETSPWAEWSKDKPLTKEKLARLLKPFAIWSDSVRIGDRTKKGYLQSDFADAFSRYLPTEKRNSGTAPINIGGNAHLQGGTTKPWSVSQDAENPNKNGPCSAVPFSQPPTEAGEQDRKEYRPSPKPVQCVLCGKVESSAVALARHLDSCQKAVSRTVEAQP